MKELHNEIARYLSGKMSAEEAQKFLKRYDSNEGRDELSQEIERLWSQESDEEDAEWNPADLFFRIQQVKENQRYLSPVPASKEAFWRKGFFATAPGRVAAAIIFMLTASGILWLTSIKKPQVDLTADATEIVKSNPAGQKTTIYLADGSKVVLNSSSKLTYYTDYGHEKRIVKLDGEAWFEVKKDTKPFIVFTHDLATTALGTSFNISSYNDRASEVALITGKVAVEHVHYQDQKVILTPGESAKLNTTAEVLEKSSFDIKTKALWKDGVIYFDHTSLEDALLTLERWYGVEITMENKMPDNLYCTGVFKNDYLNNVLESIGFSLGFKYEISNKKVKLKF